MSQTQYRANLSAKDFVFLSEQWGRSVIVKQFDQNFSRQIVSATDPDKDIGIPQIFYCHNVMPSGQGFGSISYALLLNAVSASGFAKVFYVNDLVNNGYCFIGVQILSPTLLQLWRFNPNFDAGWILTTTFATAAGQLPYTATINGQTYVYFSFNGCYTFSIATNAWTPVTLSGLTPTSIVGITEAFGYMIAWSTNAVYWSSTVTPTDFTPSLLTGAGGGQVQQILGNIGVCVANVFGFIIYSDKNAVSAVYSGNSRYPFNFRPVISGGGCVDQTLITSDPETGNQYAWTSAGLQLISVTQATNPFPELTNFIAGSRFEDFDDNIKAFFQTVVPAGTLKRAFTTISDRYFVISYSVPTSTQFTHALIYDVAMKRWGKVKINHTAVFEYLFPAAVIQNAPRRAVAFLNQTGQVYTTMLQQDSNSGVLNQGNNNGTMLLGKYQHTRNRWMTIDGIEIETVGPGGVALTLFPTYDGKTFQGGTNLASPDTGISQRYPARLSGLNISLLVQGDFNFDSMILSYHMSGRR